MRPFIYLPPRLKNDFKKEIGLFVTTYIERISPVFSSIDDESQQKAEEYYSEIGCYFDPERDDPAEYAQRAHEFGYEYWAGMMLMQYNTRLMNISTLYQYWEQQLRRFFYSELTRQHRLFDTKGRQYEFKNFCTNITQIENVLLQCGVDKNSLNSWTKINELRLVQNVIKHGDGKSAEDLEISRPDIFRTVADSETRIKDLYLSILNERALDIDDSEFIKYGEALQEFWDELPEHMYLEINDEA
ncbi:hypothetical protein NST44_16025 [Paenibacillus sp. FSL W8-0919]|uniref:hypothetical protein n=1 Tax=Paenibacillus sp. FSL W8-0919 TaxID=2954707 RepID=UPI0030FAE600